MADSLSEAGTGSGETNKILFLTKRTKPRINGAAYKDGKPVPSLPPEKTPRDKQDTSGRDTAPKRVYKGCGIDGEAVGL